MRKYWREVTILAAGGSSVILFLFVQDLSGPMGFADKYSPLFILLGAVSVGLLVSTLRRYKREDRAREKARKHEEDSEQRELEMAAHENRKPWVNSICMWRVKLSDCLQT